MKPKIILQNILVVIDNHVLIIDFTADFREKIRKDFKASL
jgi:hypothetical protein